MTYEFIETTGGLILCCERLSCTEEEADRAEAVGIDPEMSWTRTVINLSRRVPVQWEIDPKYPGCVLVFYDDEGNHILNISFDDFHAAYMRHLKAPAVRGVN